MNESSMSCLPGKGFLCALLLALVFTGCGSEGGTPPIDTLRFGQRGEVVVGVVAPKAFGEGEGELQQILTWGSTGAWVVREVISYRGLTGDETVEKSEGNPIAYASGYDSFITQVNDVDGVEIFSIPQMEDLVCETGDTRVTVSIWDEIRGEEMRWARCAEGTLATLQTSEAGPDLDASRVIQAALLVRDFTHPGGFLSEYVGSVPFGTLDRSEDSGSKQDEPRVFYSVPEGNPNPPTNWIKFWLDHNRTASFNIPPVDWKREIAIVAAVGLRKEAGDSVEVRRVLQTGEGTQILIFERVPGDFCSPAARDHYPIHIIVAPRTRLPFEFSEIEVERVNCGD
jgi:hypothetical protein